MRIPLGILDFVKKCIISVYEILEGKEKKKEKKTGSGNLIFEDLYCPLLVISFETSWPFGATSTGTVAVSAWSMF